MALFKSGLTPNTSLLSSPRHFPRSLDRMCAIAWPEHQAPTFADLAEKLVVWQLASLDRLARGARVGELI